MQIFESAPDLTNYLNKYKKVASTIGLIPTMGALHPGHLSLLKASKLQNTISVTSIFVNPIQFTNANDLALYPRPLEEDIHLLKESGCDVLFLPSKEAMYKTAPSTKLSFGHLDNVLEAAFRPGHFSGVGIVVSKLFNIIQPQTAYFGQKDLQQVAVIRQLVRDLSFPIEIIVCPVIRESDGLAMSSRNKRLSDSARPFANKIYAALKLGEEKLAENGIPAVKQSVRDFLLKYPELKLEYFEIVDAETFLEVKDVKNHRSIALCTAVYLEEVRLIDNIIVNLS